MNCQAISMLESAVHEIMGHTVDGVLQFAIGNVAFVRNDGSFRRLILCVAFAG